VLLRIFSARGEKNVYKELTLKKKEDGISASPKITVDIRRKKSILYPFNIFQKPQISLK